MSTNKQVLVKNIYKWDKLDLTLKDNPLIVNTLSFR